MFANLTSCEQLFALVAVLFPDPLDSALQGSPGLPRQKALRNETPNMVFLYKGRPMSNAYGKRAWRKACARAGLTGLRFHDLRHTWAIWLMQAGVPSYAIQALGGWASPKMVERYAHLSSEHLKQYAAHSKLKA
jgi:integrase